VNSIALNSGRGISDDLMNFPDVAVFSRTYPIDPLMNLRKFKKLGKKVVYEVDDDLWTVNPENPSYVISEEKKRQYEHLIAECDAVTTTTPTLAKKLKKFNKNVHICPNALNEKVFDKEKKKMPKDRLRIGYSGAASHWKDLDLIADAIIELQKKHDFDFILQGICARPLEDEIWGYERVLEYGLQPEKKVYMESAVKWYNKMKDTQMFHIPFRVPVFHSGILNNLDLDIGIAPLLDNEFNHSKSCVKFYEYAMTGAATLASNVLPYKKEVGYLAKNTTKDWVKKLEKLIVDEKFRKNLADKQYKWVKENRDIDKIVTLWEDALDTV